MKIFTRDWNSCIVRIFFIIACLFLLVSANCAKLFGITISIKAPEEEGGGTQAPDLTVPADQTYTQNTEIPNLIIQNKNKDTAPASMCSVESANLPTGLNFTHNADGNCVLSGTPTVATTGAIQIGVFAHAGENKGKTIFFNITVQAAVAPAPTTPILTAPSDASFTAGTAITNIVIANSGADATMCNDVDGNLPTGLMLAHDTNGDCVISGTPTTAGGPFTLRITANAGTMVSSEITFNITITAAAAFTFTTTSFISDMAIPETFHFNSTPPFPGYAAAVNSNPQIAWTNVPTGTVELVLVVHDGLAAANNWVHWILHDIPPMAVTIPEATAKVTSEAVTYGGVAMKQGFNTFAADAMATQHRGYDGPFVGAPAGRHEYVFTLYALNTDVTIGDPNFAPGVGINPTAYYNEITAELTTTRIIEKLEIRGIVERTDPLLVAPTTPQQIVQNTAANIVVSNNGAPAYTCNDGGTLPAGLSVAPDADNCVISGMPTTVGNSTVTITGSNGTFRTHSIMFDIEVTAPAPTTPILTAPSDASFTAGTAITNIVITNSGADATMCNDVGGNLPTGLMLAHDTNGDCVISGTPTTAGGPFTLRITANAGAMVSSEITFDITITAAAFTLSSPDVADGANLASAYDGTAGVNPSITWSNSPAGTVEFVLTFIDLDVPNVHWVVTDIPASTTNLPSNMGRMSSVDIGGGVMVNQPTILGQTGYVGPTPVMPTQRYQFTLHALDADINSTLVTDFQNFMPPGGATILGSASFMVIGDGM